MGTSTVPTGFEPGHQLRGIRRNPGRSAYLPLQSWLLRLPVAEEFPGGSPGGERSAWPDSQRASQKSLVLAGSTNRDASPSSPSEHKRVRVSTRYTNAFPISVAGCRVCYLEPFFRNSGPNSPSACSIQVWACGRARIAAINTQIDSQCKSTVLPNLGALKALSFRKLEIDRMRQLSNLTIARQKTQ